MFEPTGKSGDFTGGGHVRAARDYRALGGLYYIQPLDYSFHVAYAYVLFTNQPSQTNTDQCARTLIGKVDIEER
jgi:hypothetical protein